jgi:hypothetical protein
MTNIVIKGLMRVIQVLSYLGIWFIKEHLLLGACLMSDPSGQSRRLVGSLLQRISLGPALQSPRALLHPGVSLTERKGTHGFLIYTKKSFLSLFAEELTI